MLSGLNIGPDFGLKFAVSNWKAHQKDEEVMKWILLLALSLVSTTWAQTQTGPIYHFNFQAKEKTSLPSTEKISTPGKNEIKIQEKLLDPIPQKRWAPEVGISILSSEHELYTFQGSFLALQLPLTRHFFIVPKFSYGETRITYKDSILEVIDGHDQWFKYRGKSFGGGLSLLHKLPLTHAFGLQYGLGADYFKGELYNTKYSGQFDSKQIYGQVGVYYKYKSFFSSILGKINSTHYQLNSPYGIQKYYRWKNPGTGPLMVWSKDYQRAERTIYARSEFAQSIELSIGFLI